MASMKVSTTSHSAFGVVGTCEVCWASFEAHLEKQRAKLRLLLCVRVDSTNHSARQVNGDFSASWHQQFENCASFESVRCDTLAGKGGQLACPPFWKLSCSRFAALAVAQQ